MYIYHLRRDIALQNLSFAIPHSFFYQYTCNACHIYPHGIVANSLAASKVTLTSILGLVSQADTDPPQCKRGELFREMFLLFQLGFTLNSPGFW